MMFQRLHQFRRWAGVDRAVFFSNSTQIIRLVTGPLTMVLVLRYLTPEIQGYFYAFAGVVATQVFLEMGLGQSILQFTSHEFARLQFTAKGTLEGDPAARSRLISLGRLAFGYYAIAALILLLGIGFGGHIFFTLSGKHGVAWQGAWWTVAASAAGSLAINPAWSLLNGCNQIVATAKYNLWMAPASFTVNALALVFGAGIYVCAINAAFGFLCAVVYLLIRWHPFLLQFLEPPRHDRISWWHEIWPFQWRIAVSWLSSYFIFDIINPVAFYFCGPVDAGRLGMSLQLVRMVANIAQTWVFTKLPRFGMLIAARAWQELDALWRRSTAQAMGIGLLGMLALLVAIPVAGHFVPRVPARLASLDVTVWLAGGMLLQVLINAFASELRAYKREPYMWLTFSGALLTTALILPLTSFFGIYGEAVGFASAIAIMLVPALKIYQVKRVEFRNDVNARHVSEPPVQPVPATGGMAGV